MIRPLAFAACFVLAVSGPATAQGHPTHQGKAHDPATHPPMDPATHARLHDLLIGRWTGTVSTAPGRTDTGTLAITQDSLHTFRIMLTADQLPLAGTATSFVARGDTLRWTQELSGASCSTTAVIGVAATPSDTLALTGTMVCPRGDITFALKKQAR